MPGAISTKPSENKDYFRAFLNNRPFDEPNFIWPVDTSELQAKRKCTNDETSKDSYMSSFKSIYADEILIKPKEIKRDDHIRENTFDTVFCNTVRGYSVNNTMTENDSTEVFSRTITLKNNLDVRSKDKIRRQQMSQSKAPMPLRQDLIDLILSKAQALDITSMENVESETNSIINGSTIESLSSPRNVRSSGSNSWFKK